MYCAGRFTYTPVRLITKSILLWVVSGFYSFDTVHWQTTHGMTRDVTLSIPRQEIIQSHVIKKENKKMLVFFLKLWLLCKHRFWWFAFKSLHFYLYSSTFLGDCVQGYSLHRYVISISWSHSRIIVPQMREATYPKWPKMCGRGRKTSIEQI